jgi:hypothetical protein
MVRRATKTQSFEIITFIRQAMILRAILYLRMQTGPSSILDQKTAKLINLRRGFLQCLQSNTVITALH